MSYLNPESIQYKIHKGVTYFNSRENAILYAETHNLPTERIIEYGYGFAIQKYMSGSYYDAINKIWR